MNVIRLIFSISSLIISLYALHYAISVGKRKRQHFYMLTDTHMNNTKRYTCIKCGCSIDVKDISNIPIDMIEGCKSNAYHD